MYRHVCTNMYVCKEGKKEGRKEEQSVGAARCCGAVRCQVNT
jgi:hypothetical protein